MKKLDAGMIGLSVMGQNLALNLCDCGYRVGGYNRTSRVTEEMAAKQPHKNFCAFYSLDQMVASMERPRRLFLMVQAGKAVDAVLDQLVPLLDAGDMVLDCGNSHFSDTERRNEQAKKKGIYYFGVGVSGGSEGARFGPSIMPGGDKTIYDKNLRTMLEKIAAKAPDGTPCCTYMGPGGAGHFVKMVHNGIEYADMQLIAEAYLLLKNVGDFDNCQIHKLFREWNWGELESYLLEITTNILKEPDDFEAGALVDYIKDSAMQKGTGRWTVMEALTEGVNLSMIAAAGDARIFSNQTEIRRTGSCLLRGPSASFSEVPTEFAEYVRRALYAAKILAYSQGFAMFDMARERYGWDLDAGEIAGVFRAGCIIRAGFLDEIIKGYRENPDLLHLAFAPMFAEKLNEYRFPLRAVTARAIQAGVPVPVFMNAVSYLDGLRGAPMGANLIQAQRDYFGAHTYERDDRDGSFHHDWRRKK